MERQLALEILMKYKQEGSYLNLTLNSYFSRYELSKEEKNFITQVVYGTVQNMLLLEYILKPYVQGRVKAYEKMLLLMSIYQHRFMNSIPDYAIVNEAVNLAKKKKGKKTSQFINAVLKKAFQDDVIEFPKDPLEALSIQTSHPLWMVKMFTKQYGFEKTEKICIADNEVPYKSARVNTLKISREDLFNQDSQFEKGLLSEDCVYYHGGNIAHTSYFQEGLVTIQDESSQMVARLLNPTAGDYVLDMCCAPGSKTSHLAALMNNQGRIDAFDLYEHKVPLVENQMRRLGIDIVHVQAHDSTLLNEIYQPETFDKILLDGPCSGFGVMARKPEIKYHDSNAMDQIIEIQQKLLENAYELLKIGGKMVYSTCTINKKENEKQVDVFLQKHPCMKKRKEITILPYEYHSDGFYMCLLEKE